MRQPRSCWELGQSRCHPVSRFPRALPQGPLLNDRCWIRWILSGSPEGCLRPQGHFNFANACDLLSCLIMREPGLTGDPQSLSLASMGGGGARIGYCCKQTGRTRSWVFFLPSFIMSRFPPPRGIKRIPFLQRYLPGPSLFRALPASPLCRMKEVQCGNAVCRRSPWRSPKDTPQDPQPELGEGPGAAPAASVAHPADPRRGASQGPLPLEPRGALSEWGREEGRRSQQPPRETCLSRSTWEKRDYWPIASLPLVCLRAPGLERPRRCREEL